MGRILEKESSDVRKTVFRNPFVLIPEDIDVHDGKIKFLYVHSSERTRLSIVFEKNYLT